MISPGGGGGHNATERLREKGVGDGVGGHNRLIESSPKHEQIALGGGKQQEERTIVCRTGSKKKSSVFPGKAVISGKRHAKNGWGRGEVRTEKSTGYKDAENRKRREEMGGREDLKFCDDYCKRKGPRTRER